jgi:hypothetical protein
MKSLTIVAAALVAMLFANFSAAGAPAPPDVTLTSKAASKNVTFTVRQKQTSFAITGKVVTTTHNLILRGKQIGRDQIQCVLTGPGTFAECTATTLLRGGQIQEQGALDPVRQTRFTVAITGGTGIYTGASGTLDVNRSTAVATNVYHIHGVS